MINRENLTIYLQKEGLEENVEYYSHNKNKTFFIKKTYIELIICIIV